MKSLDLVIKRIHKNSEAWRYSNIEDRLSKLTSLSNVIKGNFETIKKTISEEMKRPEAEVVTDEIGVILSNLRYYIENSENILREDIYRDYMHRLKLPGRTKRIYRRTNGSGIVLVISSWNAPFQVPLGDSIEALISGHTVILKPSEYVPRTNELLRLLIKKAGLDNRIILLTGGSEMGKNIISRLPTASHIIFTGSHHTGRRIERISLQRGIYFHGELGGMDHMLIFLDEIRSATLLRRVIKLAVVGRFRNTGQNCNAVKRIIIISKEEDRSLKLAHFIARESLKLVPGIDIGEIFIDRQLNTLKAQLVNFSSQKGKENILTNNFDEAISSKGKFPPVVLWLGNALFESCADLRICSEEVFGPILPISWSSNAEDAINIVRDNPYDLNAYIMTSDISNGREVAKKLEVGSYCINDVLVNYACPDLPFGGVGEYSGQGRRHGRSLIDSLTYPQSEVVSRNKWTDENHWPPHSKKSNFLGIKLPFIKTDILSKIVKKI